MILEIVTEGHPALRAKGREITKIDNALRELAEDMIETMYDADGVGLAAQQVAMPILMFVLDVPQMKDRPSAMRINGQDADFESMMPMVLINPEVETYGEPESGKEGCLSFPGLSVDITRASSVRIKAKTIEGKSFAFEADGFLARAIQHEDDHIRGILFIDRMKDSDRRNLLGENA